jgi:hypothetical protein
MLIADIEMHNTKQIEPESKPMVSLSAGDEFELFTKLRDYGKQPVIHNLLNDGYSFTVSIKKEGV